MSVADPVFSLAEAARVCGVSRPTLQRRRGLLIEAGALQVGARWQIPLSALVAAGFTPVVDTPSVTGEQARGQSREQADGQADLVAALRAQVEDLQARLDASETERRAVAEQRDRALWAAVEATRAIEARPGAAGPVEDEPVTASEDPPARKRRWWQRER